MRTVKRRAAGTHHAYALKQYAKRIEAVAQSLWEAENAGPWVGAPRTDQAPYRDAAEAQIAGKS